MSQIIYRRTAAEWTALNPILEVGVLGIESDSNPENVLEKLGDGVTSWNSLDYVTYGPSSGGGAVDSVNGQTGTVVLTTADIADSTNKRYVTDANLTVIGNTSGTNTGDQTSVSGNAGTATALQTARNIDGVSFNGTVDITVIAPATHAATSKATPVDADELPLVDSAASNVLKKLTWANAKATLKTYFDTIYTTTAAVATQILASLVGYPKVVFKSVSDVTHTGTNAETVKISIPIAANTFAAGDVVRITIRTLKIGTAGTLTQRLRHGTNNSTADTLVQSILSAATLLYTQWQIHLIYKTTTTIQVVANSASNYTDNTNSGNAAVTVTTDVTAGTYYFVISYQQANSADTTTGSFYLIEKL